MHPNQFVNVLDGIEILPDNYSDLRKTSTTSSTTNRLLGLDQVFETVRELKRLNDYRSWIDDLKDCPEQWTHELEGRSKEFLRTLSKVLSDVNSDDRTIWSSTSAAAFKESTGVFIPAVDEIFFRVRNHRRLKEIERKLNNVPADDRLEAISDEIAQLNVDLKATKKNASRLTVDILSKGEVSTLSVILKRQRLGSQIWLCVLVAVALLVAYVIFWTATPGSKLFGAESWTFSKVAPGESSAEITSRALSKVFVSGFSIGILVLVARIYQTYLHNIVVTQQRIVARHSFRQLNAALGNAPDEIRSKLIEIAARSIFEHTSSGFLPSGTNEFSPIAQSLLDAAKKTK